MKLLILSDLHLEFGEPYGPPDGLEFDAVVLAGDISCPGTEAVDWAKDHGAFVGLPVLLVPGNHEFYSRVIDAELQAMKAAAARSNVRVLDRSEVVIGGIRFLGCTMWTDFQLPVQTPAGPEVNIERALRHAGDRLNDFRLVEIEAGGRLRKNRVDRNKRLRRLVEPADTLAMHWIDRDWLRRQLQQPYSGTSVVITHHAPWTGSVATRYEADWLTPAFASALPPKFFQVPELWIHGHTHSPFDYFVGSCRVVSNPRGYKMRDSSFENHEFNAAFVVEVGA